MNQDNPFKPPGVTHVVPPENISPKYSKGINQRREQDKLESGKYHYRNISAICYFIIFADVMAIALSVSDITNGKASDAVLTFIAFLLFVVVYTFIVSIGFILKSNKHRKLMYPIAVLMLVFIPLGTACGIYMLVNLGKIEYYFSNIIKIKLNKQ